MFIENLTYISFLYVTAKKRNNFNLTFKFRADGKIVIPGKPFKVSDIKKLNVLFAEGIF